MENSRKKTGTRDKCADKAENDRENGFLVEDSKNKKNTTEMNKQSS